MDSSLKLIVVIAVLLSDISAAGLLAFLGMRRPNPLPLLLAAGGAFLGGIATSAILWIVL